MTITLTIPFAVHSQNREHGRHWATKHRNGADYQLAIRAELNRQGLFNGALPKPGRAKVCILRYGPRTLDVGNLIGGCKGLIDAMVREGLLRDDSPKWATFVYGQRKAPTSQAHTVVSVTYDPQRGAA